MEILPAIPENIPVLRRMAIETQIDTFGEFNTVENMNAFIQEAYSVEQFEREFNEAGSIYYVAWDGLELAGFLRLRLSREAEPFLGINSIEIQRLYVNRSFQGKKVGRSLMLQALAYARDRKFEWIWLGVWERNFKAQAFYEKWGFKRFSEHIFMMGDDPQTDWLLKRRV